MFVCPYCTFKPFNTSYLSGWPLGTTWWPLGHHLLTTWWPISEILSLFVLCFFFLVDMQFSPLRYWRSSASLLLTAVKWHQRQLLKIHIQPVRNNPELLVIFLRERAVKKYGKCVSIIRPALDPMFANSMLACAHSHAHLIFPFAFMGNDSWSILFCLKNTNVLYFLLCLVKKLLSEIHKYWLSIFNRRETCLNLE